MSLPDYAAMSVSDLQAHAKAVISAVHTRVDAHPDATSRAKRRAAQLHDVADDLDRELFNGGLVAARVAGDDKD